MSMCIHDHSPCWLRAPTDERLAALDKWRDQMLGQVSSMFATIFEPSNRSLRVSMNMLGEA